MSPVAQICRSCGGLVNQEDAIQGRHPDCHARKEAERDRARASQPQRRLHQTAAHKRLRAHVFHRDGNACVDCGTSHDLTLDYLVPLQDGGEMTPDNAVTRCRSHNSSAGRRKQVSVWDSEHDRTREFYGR